VVVRYEACPAGRDCEPPERVTLEAMLTVQP